MIGIPPANGNDAEDVIWALQTAETLWRRNERVDAIVWLRRAAQAAGEAEQDDRALLLAREAAELSEWIAKNPFAPSESLPVPPSIPPNDSATGGVDDLLRTSMSEIPIEEAGRVVSMSAMTEPHAFKPMPVPVMPPPPMPPDAPEEPLPSFPAPEDEPPLPPSSSSVAVFQSVTSDAPTEEVLSAAEVHAGMLDPWSAVPENEPAPAHAQGHAMDDYNEEDVVTSAKLAPPAGFEQAVHTPPPVPKPPPPLPLMRPLSPNDSGVISSLEPSVHDVPTLDRLKAAAPVAPDPEPPLPVPPVVRFPPEQTLVSAGVVPAPKVAAAQVDLSAVEELSDLPDDARAELEQVATVHKLAREEEVMGFALAYIVQGEVDVAAQIVDAAAERLRAGAILKAKGTVAESVPLRLIAATDGAVVATWDSDQIEPAFKQCPWVEDDLRASANRTQALVGITLGPLAERLDANLRAQLTNKLELRELAEGDIVVLEGQPIKEMCVVGQGEIELVSGDKVLGTVKAGEFLFPAVILSGGKATATARAGKGGALLLASERTVAQELLVTYPPLLEIFAGM